MTIGNYFNNATMTFDCILTFDSMVTFDGKLKSPNKLDYSIRQNSNSQRRGLVLLLYCKLIFKLFITLNFLKFCHLMNF